MELGIAVKAILYTLYFSGLYLCFSGPVKILFIKIKLKKRLRRASIVKRKKSELLAYVSNILSTSIPNKKRQNIFICFDAGLALVSFILFSVNFGFVAALPFAFAACALPWLFLLIKLQKIRNKASKEGLAMVSELYRQYQISNKNIETSIEKCLNGQVSFVVIKPYLYTYLIKLRESAGEEDYNSAAKSFQFALGTNWGSTLSVVIKKSAMEGKDISLVLADIIDQLKTAENLQQERKVLNSEATRMTVFLVPLLYVGSVFAAKRFMSVGIVKFFSNQFMNPTGFTLFLACAFLFVFNIFLINLADSERLDY